MLASLVRFFQSVAPWPALALGLYWALSHIFSVRPATTANELFACAIGVLCGVGFVFVYSLVTGNVKGSVPSNYEERQS